MIRLTAIELENFKNVGRGHIELSSAGPDPKRWKSDIIGIYGQNGSGKTSVIQALCILKSIWGSGKPAQPCDGCVAAGCDSLAISVDAVAHAENDTYPDFAFTYWVKMGAANEGLTVLEEKLTYKSLTDHKPTLKTALHYSASNSALLRPKIAWDALCSLRKDFAVDAIVACRITASEGGSLLMSEPFGALLHSIGEEATGRKGSGSMSKAARKALQDVWAPATNLRSQLGAFASEYLSIVTPSRQAEPMLNIIRISTHEGNASRSADAYFAIDLSTPSFVPAKHMSDLRATINTISTVMGALVPGLSVGIKSLGTTLGENGETGERVEIVATRESVTVPLRAESEGIKKLVAILVLLVDVYAKPGCCAAIDELDSGVFEFLLGEILQVLQDHGRGQLIFTAHNLRPLETLDKTSLVFTTTNPSNRYVTFKGVKAASNLRSQYLRAINLGGQPETVYEATSKFEIDNAFYDAAHPES